MWLVGSTATSLGRTPTIGVAVTFLAPPSITERSPSALLATKALLRVGSTATPWGALPTGILVETVWEDARVAADTGLVAKFPATSSDARTKAAPSGRYDAIGRESPLGLPPHQLCLTRSPACSAHTTGRRPGRVAELLQDRTPGGEAGSGRDRSTHARRAD